MKITIDWLNGYKACSESIEIFKQQQETDAVKILETLISGSKLLNDVGISDKERLGWANWLIVRLLSLTDGVRYAIYAAEQVLEIYEAKYSDDDRPRKAIEVAKAWLENSIEENRKVAADVAYSAAYACYAVDVAYSAAYACYSAAYACYSADVAYPAPMSPMPAYVGYAVCYAANAAGYAGCATDADYAGEYNKMLACIVKYGIELLKGSDDAANTV